MAISRPVAVHHGPGAVVVVLYHAVQRHICQCRTGKRFLCGAHLAPAAVHQQKIRLLPEPVAAGLTVLRLCGVFFVFCRPAGDGLCQRGIVVGAHHGFHFELAVARLEGLAVLEGDHAADAGAIAPVGDIVALDGAGRLCQPQHLGQLIQQLFFPGVAATFPGQPFHRIGVGHLHQTGLVAPLGHIQLHLAAALLVQRLLQGIHVRRQRIHRDDLGNLLIVQIVPGQKFLPHRVDVGGVMEQELPLVGEPPFAEAQHRRAYAAGRTGQRHHVHLYVRVHDHLLPGAHLGDGVDLVPDEGRRLELQPVGGLQHPLVESFQDILFAVTDQVHRPFYRLVVGLAADLAAAHRHALANVGVQAGPPLADVLWEALGATRQQKGIHGGLCHLPCRKAGGVGADILCPVLLLLQGEGKARPVLPGDADIAVALVILEQDVVFGGVGLDLAGFQHQCLEFALADDDVKGVGVGDHLADLVVVGHALAEILAHPDAQALGLADINDGVAFVPDDIHPGQQRQHTGLLVQLCLGHLLRFLPTRKKRQGTPAALCYTIFRLTLQSRTPPA